MSCRVYKGVLVVFCKKGVLRNSAKFTEKHLCQSLFCNKVAALKQATLLKKRLWHRCFPVDFAKFLRTPFLTEQLRWLLLYVILKILNVAEFLMSLGTNDQTFVYITVCFQILYFSDNYICFLLICTFLP